MKMMNAQIARTKESFKPVRLALVGCGMLVEGTHLPAVFRSPILELGALVDNQIARADLLKRKYGCRVKIAGVLEDVLADVDGVVIATPNYTHVPLARSAVEHGVPAFVEKPLSTTYSDAKALCDLAREKRTFVAVGFQGRHFPAVKLMKRLLTTSFFGQIRSFHFEYGSRGGWAPVSGYNLSREQSGGGVLVGTGSHFLDRIIYWFGEPERVEYSDDGYGGVEANCKGRMEYENNVTGTFFFSKTVALKNCFVLETESYRVEMSLAETTRITLFPKAMPDTKMSIEEAEATPADVDYYQVELEDFALAIRTGRPPAVDGLEGARSVKLSENLYACRTELKEPWGWYRTAKASLVGSLE
jgi:predicted dehydrogenase